MKKITSMVSAIAILAAFSVLTGCSHDLSENSGKSEESEIVVSQPEGSSDTDSEASTSDEDNSDGDTQNDDTSDEESGNSESSEGNEDNEDGDTSASLIPGDNARDDNSGDNSDGGNSGSVSESGNASGNDPAPAGSALPLKEYPDGSYFTNDGKSCGSHSDCTWTADCNCRNFDMSIQSPGFAKYVYFRARGKHLSLADKTAFETVIDKSSAKDILGGLPEGTYIAVDTAGEHFHAMALLDTSDSGIKVYQANYGGGCVVRVSEYTWEDFAARFPKLHYFVK